jgi:uncharacterized tellurite resistance protein B-like protein
MVKEFRASMLDAVQDFLEERLGAASEKQQLQLATAALFIEMTRADFEIRPEESKAVTRAVERALDVSPEETAQIVELAEQEVDAAGSLHQFARLIDRRFSMEQKKRVVKLLWRGTRSIWCGRSRTCSTFRSRISWTQRSGLATTFAEP